MEYKDYYKILGVERGADQDNIKKAFRRQAAKYHPDRNRAAGAEERFKEVNEAYEVLGDADKRKQYDQLGSSWHSGENFRPPPGWGNSKQFDASFFEHIARGGFNQTGTANNASSSGFSDFFESLFGGSARRAPPPGNMPPGADQTATITLDLEEVCRGVQKTIRLPSGESLQIRIPAGIYGEKKIRLPGKGPKGSDVFLKVKLKEHPLYRVEYKDIFLELPISPWEAALGETVTVPTLTGKISLKIPGGSQTGRKMRLKGRGLPGNEPGDLYVVLNINTPPADTTAQKEYYARMKALFDWNPRQHLRG